MYGYQLPYASGFARTAVQVIGYLRGTGGPGFLIIAGDGLLFTMETGFTTMSMAGCGYRDMTGRRPGLPGENMEEIIAGRPLAPIFRLAPRGIVTGLLLITGRLCPE